MPQFLVYAPLSQLFWQGAEFTVAPGIEIIRRPQPYPLNDLEDQLSQFDRHELFYADHWLRVEWSQGEEPSAGELVNLFLLSLWLAKPTKTHVKFRFRVATNLEETHGRVSRIFSHFQPIPDATVDHVADTDLERAALFFPVLREIRLRRGRLANALHLTYAGCTADQWQVILVCYAAAAEALLTYSRDGGITRRLARTYALLVEPRAEARNQLTQEFERLYGKRSDVMHGRGHDVGSEECLCALAEFRNVLRRIWAAILESPSYREVLEGSDEQRKAFFRELQGSYNLPPAGSSLAAVAANEASDSAAGPTFPPPDPSLRSG